MHESINAHERTQIRNWYKSSTSFTYHPIIWDANIHWKYYSKEILTTSITYAKTIILTFKFVMWIITKTWKLLWTEKYLRNLAVQRTFKSVALHMNLSTIHDRRSRRKWKKFTTVGSEPRLATDEYIWYEFKSGFCRFKQKKYLHVFFVPLLQPRSKHAPRIRLIHCSWCASRSQCTSQSETSKIGWLPNAN